MEFQDVFTDLRKKAGLSQNDAADRLFVTRQAVSRWERGETVPETETLLAISKLFGVSINTLLGSPRTLVCQSCGMPLSDDYLAREADGSFNEKYCKWCWVDGAGALPGLHAGAAAHLGAVEAGVKKHAPCFCKNSWIVLAVSIFLWDNHFNMLRILRDLEI